MKKGCPSCLSTAPISWNGNVKSGYHKNINTIGDHIRKKQIDLGLYQKEVAEIIGISEATIYNWENNITTNPPVSVYPKIYMFLGYVPYNPIMPFHEKLGLIQKALGFTQREFASRIGFDPSTVLRWKRGMIKPGQQYLAKIKQCFVL